MRTNHLRGLIVGTAFLTGACSGQSASVPDGPGGASGTGATPGRREQGRRGQGRGLALSLRARQPARTELLEHPRLRRHRLERHADALALGLAVETLDAAYATSTTQLRELTAWNAERALGLYRAGAVMPTFAWSTQDAYFTAWRTSPDAAALRNYARRTFGAAYCTKVLEIGAAAE